jgi:hypothetical protein
MPLRDHFRPPVEEERSWGELPGDAARGHRPGGDKSAGHPGRTTGVSCRFPTEATTDTDYSAHFLLKLSPPDIVRDDDSARITGLAMRGRAPLEGWRPWRKRRGWKSIAASASP